MSKYEEYVRKFHEDYEEPTVDGYIVGNSGLTPKPKVKPEKINHDELGGLKGGDFDGYYHVTGEELDQFSGYHGQIEELEEKSETLTREISSARQEATTAVTNLRTETNLAIASAREEASTDVTNLRNDTEEDIASARQEASTAVSNLRTQTTQAINTARTEASTAVNTLRNETLQEITEARQEATSAVSTLRTQTNTAITAARQEAASSITALRNETAQDITEIRTQTNTAVTSIRSETTQKLNQMSSALDTAKSEISGRMSTVEGSQAEIEASQENIRARIDEIVGGVTEDSEILDARVDADSNIHPNLGANIRNIHGLVKSAESTAREREHVLYEHIQEQENDLSEAILREALDRRDAQEGLKGLIANWQKRSQGADEHMLEGINELSAGEMQTALNLMEESLKRKHAEKVSLREITQLQEGVNENANSLMKIALQVSEGTSGGTIYRNPMDWSKAESIAIPEPRCAVVNITGIESWPTSKTVELSAVMEFWDMAGNYFKKNISCAAQGDSSLNHIKKNVKFDLLNEDGTEFEMKIGDWVSQDGFHLKAYYIDYFRGRAAAMYKFYDEIVRFNGTDKDRPYKKALGVTEGVTPTGGTLYDLELQLETGALCHPDGFPCIVNLNGNFYGIFAWQIKKQRKNYHMEKSNVTHIHLDGRIYGEFFWDGVIDWTKFEVRNPNKLYTMDGKKYDGDDPKELIDATSEKYDPSNKDHVRTAKVKGYIQLFVSRYQEMKSLYAGGNTEGAKAIFDEIFDMENVRDYQIFADVIRNWDGFNKNWQWITYDGVKWWVNPYDLDLVLGGSASYSKITPPETKHVGTSNYLRPNNFLIYFYNTELEQRYKELRNAGIIETEHVLAYLRDWVSRIGTANYEREYEKWPNSPCIVSYADSIYRVKKWLEVEIANMDNVYHYTA